MDKIIDARFERVEKALTTLINSISTYNPSPGLANDLVAADAELNQGLEQLSAHQSNYSKILALRTTSATLDAQIRDTLTLLTSTRTDLLATPATTIPNDTNPVSYSELLSYARRISKFTRAAAYREPDAQASTSEGVDGAATGNATPKDGKSESQTNGTTTPIGVANTNGVEKDVNAMEIDSSTPVPPPTATAAGTTSQDTNTALPEHITTWIDPLADQQFIPWPTEDKLRRGALASIQMLTEQGIDPASFDPEKSAELEAERKRVMEEEDAAREREQERLEAERRRRLSVAAGAGGGGAAPRTKKSFELEDFEEDDDE